MKLVQQFEFPTKYGKCIVRAEIDLSSPSWKLNTEADGFLKEIREKLDDACKSKDYS